MKTPSYGIDQNRDGKFIDRYWGRVPQFLKWIPEAYICEANPDYLMLMEAYVDGSIIEENIEPSLYQEIANIILNIGCPCLLTGKERQIMNAYLGNSVCEAPSHKLTCTDSICCNSLLMCESTSVCEEEPVEPPVDPCYDYSEYLLTPGTNESNQKGFKLFGDSMGTLTLVDGIDLQISSLFSASGGGDTYYFQSNYDCNGQTAVEMLDASRQMVVNHNENVSGYNAEWYDSSGNPTFYEDNMGSPVTIFVKRVGCDQCNLQQPN